MTTLPKKSRLGSFRQLRAGGTCLAALKTQRAFLVALWAGGAFLAALRARGLLNVGRGTCEMGKSL